MIFLKTFVLMMSVLISVISAFAPTAYVTLRTPSFQSSSLPKSLRMSDDSIPVDSTAEKAAALMDEGIYNFNKVIIDTVYDIICFVYPVKGTKRDFARFYVLETVARVPYFAYLSVMHLRETFGERGIGDRMRTHYAEADNELHHLLIMEALGGNANAVDRFIAQTMAFFYYWYVTVVYFFSEQAAYHLSELIEDHGTLHFSIFRYGMILPFDKTDIL